MSKLIKEFKIFSMREKAVSVALIVVVCSLAMMITASAQPVSAVEKGKVVDPNAAVFTSQKNIDTTARGRAPEPSTIVLMGSGFMAALVRFARRRFEEFKRFFDIFVALVGLILSFPIVLASVLIIKITSPGSILYRQIRLGKDGVPFEILKLRTMVSDAEDQTGPVWAKEDDPRITPFGKFMRKSHIDEIPQLVNVLKGEMSIIGPRPERPEFVKKLSKEISDYPKRLRIKPGITGLAQVKHSYDSTIKDVKKKVKLDLLYIKRMCFLTDLRILLGTVTVVLTGKGAR